MLSLSTSISTPIMHYSPPYDNDVNKDLGLKAKDSDPKAKDLSHKAKDLGPKAKPRTRDIKFKFKLKICSAPTTKRTQVHYNCHK